MEIEVKNTSGATKRIRAVDRVVRDGKAFVLASWMMDGDCFIDLETGDVLAEVMPIVGGIYEVDLDTGRLVGASWRVPMADLDSLSSAPIGRDLIVEHVRSGDREWVQLVDSEPSRGIVRVMSKGGRHTGRCLTTGWRVTSADLAQLRRSSLKRVA